MKPPVTGHVVKDFYIGNAHILICDDYCRDRTQEEIDQILKNIGRIWYEDQMAQLSRATAGRED